MSQVVTSENMLELIQTGRVADFVAPKPEGETKDETKTEEKTGEVAAEQQPAAKTTEEPKKPESVDDELPEKVQKRINEKHRQMKEAEEFGKAQYLEKLAAEKRVGELEAKVAEFEKSKAPATDKADAQGPKPEDFETTAKYVDARVEWELKQREAASEQRKLDDEQKAVDAAHQARIKAAAARIPDYVDVVDKSDLMLAMPLIQFIRESESGPELAYHLAKNPDVAERLNRMKPIKALAEMGKLEAKLTVEPAKADEPKAPQKQPETSKAPAPITPIDGKKEPVKKDPADMSFAELREHNEQQRRLKAQKKR